MGTERGECLQVVDDELIAGDATFKGDCSGLYADFPVERDIGFSSVLGHDQRVAHGAGMSGVELGIDREVHGAQRERTFARDEILR